MAQEQNKVSKDILDDANRLYPIELTEADIDHQGYQNAYIDGRMDQLAKQQLPASESAFNIVTSNIEELGFKKKSIPVSETVEEAAKRIRKKANKLYPKNYGPCYSVPPLGNFAREDKNEEKRNLWIAGATWANQQPFIKIEDFSPVTKEMEGEKFYASIPSIKGLGESGKTPQDAIYELLLSLEVKLCYDNNIPLSDKRLKQSSQGYKELVLRFYPDAGIIIHTSGMSNQPPERTTYIIQRDKNMKFTDCEEDSDFLTEVEANCLSEEAAWKSAFELIVSTYKPSAPIQVGQISPVMNKVINDLDALDSFLQLGIQADSHNKVYEDLDMLVESLKTNVRILRDESVRVSIQVSGWEKVAKDAWNEASGIDWDAKNGYHSPTFEEWFSEYKLTHSPIPDIRIEEDKEIAYKQWLHRQGPDEM